MPHDPAPSPDRSRWRTAGWAVAVLFTALNGFVVGYGAVWFQLFGSTPDVEDYLVSAGGYGAAAVVLALTVPALLARETRRHWLAWTAGTIAAMYLGLTAVSLQESTRAEQLGTPVNGVWDGVGGVIWAPWTWVMVVLGVRALIGLGPGRGRRAVVEGWSPVASHE